MDVTPEPGPPARGAAAASRAAPAVRIPGGRIAEIEALRAVAILMVLLEHAPLNLLWWGGPFTMGLYWYGKGWTGVDVFFAISGFVIARTLLPRVDATPLAESVPLLVRFWIRRAWRLFPSAWLWLAVILGLSLVFNRSNAFHAPVINLETGIAAFLDLENFHQGELMGRHEVGIAFPYWSLSLEEQFYLVLPVAMLVLRSWIVVAVGLVLCTTLLPETAITMVTRGGALALGVLLALWERRSPATHLACMPRGLATRRAARIACLVLPVVCLIALGSDHLSIVAFRLLPISLLAGFLVWLAGYDRGLLWRDGASRRAMVWIGERSYAIYLVHAPVFATAHEMWFRWVTPYDRPHGWAQLGYEAAALAAVFALAAANYRWLETPLRRRGGRIAAAWNPGAGEAAR